MLKTNLFAVLLAVGTTGLPITGAVADDVNVGVHIGIPAPPPRRIFLPAPPPVVIVPNKTLSYAPDVEVDFNPFVDGGRYCTFHDGAWFYAPDNRGPCVFIPMERVNRPVVGVPIR